MTVILDLFSHQAELSGQTANIWAPFMNYVDSVYNSRCSKLHRNEKDFINIKTQLLAEWGAETDWYDETSPLYFKDQESLTAFVLAWRK